MSTKASLGSRWPFGVLCTSGADADWYIHGPFAVCSSDWAITKIDGQSNQVDKIIAANVQIRGIVQCRIVTETALANPSKEAL